MVVVVGVGDDGPRSRCRPPVASAAVVEVRKKNVTSDDGDDTGKELNFHFFLSPLNFFFAVGSGTLFSRRRARDLAMVASSTPAAPPRRRTGAVMPLVVATTALMLMLLFVASSDVDAAATKNAAKQHAPRRRGGGSSSSSSALFTRLSTSSSSSAAAAAQREDSSVEGSMPRTVAIYSTG